VALTIQFAVTVDGFGDYMAGRRPKPLAMHQLNGNPSMLSKAELSGADNPQPENGIPEMPKGMARLARREWKQITPLLLSNGLLSKVDGKALLAYCEAYARWQEAAKLIDKYGPVIRTSFETKDGEIILGDLKSNPAVSQTMQWLKLMKSYLIEFGLTPASRRNLKINKVPANDPGEDFMNRRKLTSVGSIPTPVRPEDMIDE
jgi:P27 family predicted phage terminase small subunit